MSRCGWLGDPEPAATEGDTPFRYCVECMTPMECLAANKCPKPRVLTPIVEQMLVTEGDKETQLLGCPFCGAEPYLHEPSFPSDGYQIGCRCGADEDDDSPGACWRDGSTFEEAAQAWNRREGDEERSAEGSLREQLARSIHSRCLLWTRDGPPCKYCYEDADRYIEWVRAAPANSPSVESDDE